MAGAQEFEEVQPALAGCCTKPGEVVVADLRAGAVRGLVAGSGVIHRDPGRLRQPGAQHIARLIEKTLVTLDEQAHDLPRGDGQTNGPQLRHQARKSDLPLMVLGQHKAAQFGPEVAIDPARQRRHDQLPVRRQPALPAIADAAGPQDQVLNDEICVALKPRAGWHRGLDDLVFDGHARRHRTAAALAKVRRLRLAGLLHSARFERWPALEPFQPCDLRTLGRYRLLQGRHLAQQPDDKRLQFSQGECVEVTGWSHPSRESEASVSGKRKPRCRHPFCRCYRNNAKIRPELFNLSNEPYEGDSGEIPDRIAPQLANSVSSIQNNVPGGSYEAWEVNNCAEFNSANRALLANPTATLADLDIHTVDVGPSGG